MSSQNREEKPFVPNPSKTPLTNEMMSNVRKILKKAKDAWDGDYDAKNFVNSFTVPTEKEDMIAMYLACKTNGWGEKERAIAEQMQTLFKNDQDVIKLLGIFVPNPNSKTPLTDELMFNFKKLCEERHWNSDIEEYIASFKIPQEKEDIMAMYLACKTNKGDRFEKWEEKQEAIATQMQMLFKDDPHVQSILKADNLWVKEEFVPNPNSKTPLTDEMKFHVRQLQKDKKSKQDIEKAIENFVIPTEKEDIVAMYFACKTSKLSTKKAAVFEQMKLLFKNDPDVKGIIEDEEAKKAAKREAKEKARLEEEKDEARSRNILLGIFAFIILAIILCIFFVK